MALFGSRHKKTKIIIENDLSSCNHLPAELKVKILRAQLLMDETESRMAQMGVDVSLPYKLQLKGDIEDLNRRIDDFASGRARENAEQQFELAVQRFQTVAENVLHFRFEK
ncbi:MAG: hypothetical protein Q4B85_07190 [Lachnospiraceae bacterium]|nr:hypothetical protein [Lachnospiraceae bacterium]